MLTLQPITDRTLFDKYAPHVTQSWEWGEFRLKTGNVTKVLRLGSFEKDKLLKVYQIFFHRTPLLSYSIAYLPRPMTPTSAELDVLEKICQEQNALFLKIEPTTELPSHKNFRTSKPILPRHTVYVDLFKPEDKILSLMHEKTRYNIRLAQKKGVVVKNETSPEALENFIELLERTEIRQGFYSHYPQYYRQLWNTLFPKKMIYLLNAYIPETEKPVASIMLFHFKEILYYPYGGSNPEFREYMAPNLLHWEAMKLGKKLGCTTYDMWGTYKNKPDKSDPWWGIYRFKTGFGGTEFDFPPTVDIPLSPLYPLYLISDTARWPLLHLKQKLPKIHGR